MKKLVLSISVFMLLGISFIQGQYQSEITAPNDKVLQLESPSSAFGSGPILNWKSDLFGIPYNATAVLIPRDSIFSHRTNSFEFRTANNGRYNFFHGLNVINPNDILMTILANGRVGIGTIDPQAQLDVSSTSQGFLLPRMTSAQRLAISSPSQSTMVYDITTKSFQYFENGIWNELGAGGGGGIPDQIADADNDTHIRVEQSPDEDIIRFNLAGVEKFIFRNNANGVQRIGFTSSHQNTLYGQAAGSNINPTGTGVEGTLNTIIGSFAGIQLTTGHSNTFIGQGTGNVNTGSRNTMIGRSAGSTNTGSDNVFIGYQVGKFEAGNHKLYIDNSDIADPLIYGEFDNNLVRVNGDTEIEGDLKLGKWQSGSSGDDSTQLLLSGQHNAGVNKGSTAGTYKLKIEGYDNDGSLVYPIHVMNENGFVDFFLRNSSTATSQPPVAFFRGRVGIGAFMENPAVKLQINGFNDADLTTGSGAFQLGGSSQQNLLFDNDEILSRNNGANSTMFIQAEGGPLVVGGGTAADGFALSVNGKIATEEVLVDLVGDWPDYVFQSDYKLNTLEEVEAHINEKGHLPGVPSAQEVEEDGIQLGEMNKILMEKIEELTLYIIEQEKINKHQEARLNLLEKSN